MVHNECFSFAPHTCRNLYITLLQPMFPFTQLIHTFNHNLLRYHLQSDELLGSWLFVGANLPFIPYALLYLATEESNLEYLGALAISVCLMIGSGLFVMCCYPSDKVSVCFCAVIVLEYSFQVVSNYIGFSH